MGSKQKARQRLARLHKEAKFQEAYEAAKEWVARHANDPLGYQVLGASARRLGKFTEAIEALKVAHRRAPGDRAIQRSLGRALVAGRRWKEAEELLSALPPDGPDAGIRSLLLCRVCQATGRTGEALEHAARAVALAPEDFEARYAHARALREVGRLEESLEGLREVLQIRVRAPLPVPLPPRPHRPPRPQELRLLWRTLHQFAEAGVHAFPTAGTLLGLVREGGLLPGDKDFDVGLPFAEMERAIACLFANGWKQEEDSYGLANPRTFHFPKVRMALDLCGLARDPVSGVLVSGFWMRGIPVEWNRFTEFPELRLRKQDSPEGRVWMPSEPERWLEALYGDWRTPDPTFDTVICAKNLRGFSKLTQYYAFQRIYALWDAASYRKALVIVRVALDRLGEDALLREIEQRLLGVLAESEARADA